MGYPLRMSSAVALTNSSILTIQKDKMLQMLQKNNKTSNDLVAYLLSSVKNYQDHVSDLLTFSAEPALCLAPRALAAGAFGQEWPASGGNPSIEPPDSGRDDWHDAITGQFFYEPVPKA